MEAQRSDTLQSTVIITDRFAERRAQLAARHEPMADTFDVLEPGTKFDRYLILNRLGGGGMGVVYRAHDTELNRTVALKVLPLHLCEQPEYLSRFRAEARAQARLNSPHIVTLYSLMESAAGVVLVLEYVEGETLEQRLRRQGPMPIAEAARVFEQALRGLEHIHQMGVLHRDLKPSNLFLAREGTVKIMDFGVAKLMDDRAAAQRGAMVGTMLYISPEQINGRDTDFRSDIYTLGICLFEAVTGRLPFERRTDYALMHAHVQENPPSPRQLQRGIPAALERTILKAIEKDPNRRFQNVQEFRAALLDTGVLERRGAADDYPARRPARAIGLRGAWFDAALVATVLVLVSGLGIVPAKHTAPAENLAMAVTTAPKVAAPDRTITVKAPAKPARSPTKTARSAPAKPKAQTAKGNDLEHLRLALGG